MRYRRKILYDQCWFYLTAVLHHEKKCNFRRESLEREFMKDWDQFYGDKVERLWYAAIIRLTGTFEVNSTKS